ncbi:unnamed protein product [Pelagomonas calceolata]|uniref:MYND-type domain-containing protein n=1 Tax=Pelagomonas calceolata TaxID=35677 RepID=A0A8J2STM6_9STRA|nr:unnamed protein product [Pelagomonas calceolata]
MILTTCAACAAPLAHNAPRCVRCHTRYCNKTCQMDHWRRGHKQICKRIHRGGNAEQYYAEKKYKEAVAVAVEACAADTKGQTCYICTQALHWKTKEGLVRMCACRGTAGFAHVSCLAEQAKILLAEAEENNLDLKTQNARWQRWDRCGLCEQMYHGPVKCALGWACWKTYLGRPEDDGVRIMAMSVLGNGLALVGQHEDALSVRDAELSASRRFGITERHILIVQGHIAITYEQLGRFEDALRILKDVHCGCLKLYGEEHERTLRAANNCARNLVHAQRHEEAKSRVRTLMPVARRVLGESHSITLTMRLIYAGALYRDDDATLEHIREAVNELEDADRIARRVFGGAHPLTKGMEAELPRARAALRARETPSTSA